MEIKDIKTKIISTLGEIDLSKLTLADLQTYVKITSDVELIAKEPDKNFLDIYSKLCENFTTVPGVKVPTIGDMKGDNHA